MPNSERSEPGVFARASQAAENRAPATAMAVIYTVFVFVIAAITFAALTPVRELTRALGTLEPIGGAQQIEHLTGGIVKAVHVEEGELVASGQVIAELSAPPVVAELDSRQAELRRVRSRLADLEWVIAQLSGGSEDRNASGGNSHDTTTRKYAQARLSLHQATLAILAQSAERAQAELTALEDSKTAAWERVELVTRRIERLSKLARNGHVSEFRLMDEHERLEELRSDAMSASVALERVRSQQAADRARHDEEALKFREAVLRESYDTEMEIARLEAELANVERQIADLTIRAPEDGIIQSVAFPSVGEVVGAGDALFDLLPVNQALVAEVRLELKDIGHVQTGNRVKLKADSYDYRKFGGVGGEIRSISPDLVEDPDGSQYFRAIVSLDRETIGVGTLERQLRPGMQVSAEIQTGSRTVLAYLLKPIESSLQVAFSER